MVDRIFQQPKSEAKWNELITSENIDWYNTYNLNTFRVTLNQRLRYFQFRILHRNIGVNKLLFNMGISSTNICSLCSISIETISHLFWECPVTKKFILQIQNSMLSNEIVITREMFLFGSNDNIAKDYNFLFLYAKYFIFSAKNKASDLSLSSFCKLLHQINTEEHMSANAKKYISFTTKWRLIQWI